MNMPELSEEAQAAYHALAARIEQNEIDVPMLPEVAGKVLNLANDPESDASQMANLIQSDQAMAANILHIANSPAYAPVGNITSLQQAVSRLGLRTLADVAIAASVNSKMFNAPGFEARIKTLWGDALLTALWSKEIAQSTKIKVDAAFLCGLLHSIGRPMLLQWLADEFPSLSREETLAVEESLYIQANRAVAKAWGLPEMVLQGISEYLGDVTALPDIARVVRAGILMTAWSKRPDDDPASNEEHGAVLATFNLTESSLNDLKMKFNDVNATADIMHA
jgi:HD-like signal output (HDOD) protein